VNPPFTEGMVRVINGQPVYVSLVDHTDPTRVKVTVEVP
jgi:hypothetical protein